ncbi:hypothetical protein ABBQ32_008759 [Trebouxia sp. C0010 RCD-2024]
MRASHAARLSRRRDARLARLTALYANSRGSGSGFWVGCGTGLLGGEASSAPVASGRKHGVAAVLRPGDRPADVVRAFNNVRVIIKAGTQQDIRECKRYEVVRQHAGGNDQLALLYLGRPSAVRCVRAGQRLHVSRCAVGT